MKTCPYPVHSSLIPAELSDLPISFCKAGCSRTFFFCPNCNQEANQPLARYCRRCGEPVSFSRFEAKYEDELHFESLKDEKYSYNLSIYDVGEVHELISYRSYLFVITSQSVLLFDVHNLSEPMSRFSPPGNSYIRNVTVYSSAEDEYALVTTLDGVYRLSLLDFGRRSAPIYRCPATRKIMQAAVCDDGQIYTLEYDLSSKNSSLVRIPDNIVASFKDLSYSMLVLTDQIFFFTKHQLFLYNCKSNSLFEKTADEDLKDTPPAYNKELECIFLVGEHRIWRFDMDQPEATIMPINTRPFGNASIASKGHNLIVAHSDGFCVLDPFGGIKWDSNNFIYAQSDGLPPQIYGDIFTFTSIGRVGGRALRIHKLSDPSGFGDPVIFDRHLLCSPLFCLDRMIVAVGDERSTELNAYDLNFYHISNHRHR